ncbi:hypothetical protein C0J52_09820 [Blattella germanica]|nr:hypothetical protein C0J52_09820 [Blattella germanica]
MKMSFEHEDNSSCETECELLNNSNGDCNNHADDDGVDGNENSDIENELSIAYDDEFDGDDDDDDDDADEDDNVNVNGCNRDRNAAAMPSGSDEDTDDELLDVKPGNMELNHNSSPLHDMTRIRWPPGSWQDGTRKSAFQPYRPTLVLTNLQRGNMPTESSTPEQTDVSFHHRAGQGEISAQDAQQENDIDAKDGNGLSALMWASAYGQVPTVQLLIKHGARIDLEGTEGETSLLLAAAGGHHDVVRLLLTEEMLLSKKIGNTALMYAAHGDHPHCTNELLLRGADITMNNLNDDTAFGIAVKRGSKLAQAVIENYLLTLLS